MANTVVTRVHGHFILAQRVITTGRWEVTIDGNRESWQDIPFALRSTYESDLPTALSAAMNDVCDYEDTRSPFTGHTPGCYVQATLDESDCDCK